MKKSTPTSAIIVTIALEIIVIFFAHIIWLRDISTTIGLFIMLTIIDYLIFSIFEFYSLDRLKKHIVSKSLISMAITVILYCVFLFMLNDSNVLKSSNGITEMSLIEIIATLSPSLFVSLACLVNFMSNEFKYFMLKTILYYTISVIIVIVGNPLNKGFLSGLIVVLIGPIQLIIGLILSLLKKSSCQPSVSAGG